MTMFFITPQLVLQSVGEGGGGGGGEKMDAKNFTAL